MAKYLDSTGLNQLWTACKGLFLTAATGDQRYICSFNNASTNPSIDTFINYQCLITQADSGSWGGGTQPSGAHNGLGILNVHTHTGYYYTQLALDTNQNYLWIRSCNNGESYGSWERLAKASELSWSSISGKPSTFTPSSHTHSYLPLSGGTLSSSSTDILTINSTSSSEAGILFNRSGTTKAWIGYHDIYGVYLYNSTRGKYLNYKDDGSLQFEGNTVLHSGNYTTWAADKNHTHSYLPLSGGTVTGNISRDDGGSWISGRDHVVVEQTRTSTYGNDYHPVVGIKTSAGYWSLGSVGGESLMFSYDTDSNYSAGNNTSAVISLPDAGLAGTLALTSQIPTPLSNSEIDGIIV